MFDWLNYWIVQPVANGYFSGKCTLFKDSQTRSSSFQPIQRRRKVQNPFTKINTLFAISFLRLGSNELNLHVDYII